ncbi:MAG: nucleotidyltransferase family protein [Candidatus Magasanikbacteria bacterium]|jgi:mannose-1-phosphate guanylyltransferase
MKAIILAGGLGTRLRPLTENTPKPLLPIKNRPIIEHAILNFKKHGITDIILSVGFYAEKIKNYFDTGEKFGVKISYSIEDQPLGTGGAIKKAATGIDETFLVINGDNLADFDWTSAVATHKINNAQITLSLFPVEDVTQYGIAHLDNGKILRFIEKPKIEEAPSNLNNAGGYVLEPEILNILPDGVSSIERDCFEKMALLGVVFAHTHAGQWFPTDTLEKYQHADEHFAPPDDQSVD